MSRMPIVVANWKMYKTIPEAQEFVRMLMPQINKDTQLKVFLAVPFIALPVLAQESALFVGAQNMHDAEEGAFTGEISAKMLKSCGAHFVILGHSERRTLFQETSSWINRKVKRAVKEGLVPLLCVGESLQEREEGRTQEVLFTQLEESLEDLTAQELSTLIIAYEPVWAIGTGKTATPELAQETHALIRTFLAQKWGSAFAEETPILYGGSVKAENSVALIGQKDIDGALIGGASLDVTSFAKIIHHIGSS